jgi:hypothetical protein
VPTESGRPVSLTGDEYAAIIDELIILHEATTGFEIPVEHKRAALVLAAMEAETTEAGRATRVLMNAGLHDATALHVRKALEFGVTAQWIAATPNGVDAFFAESERGVRALYEEGKQSGQQMPKGHRTAVRSKGRRRTGRSQNSPLVRPHRRNVWQAQRDLSAIPSAQRALPSVCHEQSGAALQAHQQVRRRHGATHNRRRAARRMAVTLGIALLWAASAVDQYVVNEPRSDTLSAIAERLGVPARLEPAPPAS